MDQIPLREDVVEQLRKKAKEGASVSELVHLIQARCGYSSDKVIPVLFYFMNAFDLSLDVVLPLRELIGSDEHDRMDEILSHAITASLNK